MQLLKVMCKYCHGVLSRKNLNDYQKKHYYISCVKKKKVRIYLEITTKILEVRFQISSIGQTWFPSAYKSYAYTVLKPILCARHYV